MKLWYAVAFSLVKAHGGPHALISAVITTRPACECHVWRLSGLETAQPGPCAVRPDAVFDAVPVDRLFVPLRGAGRSGQEERRGREKHQAGHAAVSPAAHKAQQRNIRPLQ